MGHRIAPAPRQERQPRGVQGSEQQAGKEQRVAIRDEASITAGEEAKTESNTDAAAESNPEPEDPYLLNR